MHVIPALLTNDLAEFEAQLTKLLPLYSRFQIDIADGKFVPNTTLSVEQYLSVIEKLGATDRQYDFHLMVQDYETEIKKLQSHKNDFHIGPIFVHASLSPNPELLTLNYSSLSFGLVLNPEDSVDTIRSKYNLSKISNIQIMTIEPGFQGQPFIPETLQKIEQLRISNYKASIFIDGSVNEKTVPTIRALKYQPDFLCVGSYLTKATSPATWNPQTNEFEVV